jgi:hypothetical protein
MPSSLLTWSPDVRFLLLSAKGLLDIHRSQLKNLSIRSPDVGFLLLSAKGLCDIRSLTLALGRVSSPLLVLHVDTRLSSKRVINSCLSNGVFLVLWFIWYCLLIHKMASFQSQSTYIQLSSKISWLRMSSDLQPAGFCCSHPRIALVALSRMDNVVYFTWSLSKNRLYYYVKITIVFGHLNFTFASPLWHKSRTICKTRLKWLISHKPRIKWLVESVKL